MIIAESEWNRAAGINEQGEDCPVSPPSYDDTLAVGVPGPSSLSPRSRGGSRSVSRHRESHPSPHSPPALPHRAEGSSTRRHEERVQHEPTVFTFIQQSPNSMLLTYIQPAISPLYHISTYANCFIPTSHITVVRRGDSDDGKYVGQFEMGVSVKKSTVILDGKEKLTDAVLVKFKDKSNVRTLLWKWFNDESRHLNWSYEGPVKYCHLRSIGNAQPPMLASYTPPPLTPRADGRPAPPTMLKVYPAGQDFMDHIIVSALIIERKRLTPTSANTLMSFS